MIELFNKYKVYLLVGLSLLAALIFYSLHLKNREHAGPLERSVMNVMAPASKLGSAGNGFFSGLWSDYLDLVNVRRENKELRRIIKLYNARETESREALMANERLKSLLELKTSTQVPSLAAGVIGEDGSPWFKTLFLDRGAAEGLQEGMPVVAVDGVIGRLVKVAAESSRVLLLTDHASGIAAVVQRSRARGVVKGTGDGRCSLEFTLRDEDVKVGDVIVTSGVGGGFPKGLKVGEVTMVKKGAYGIFQTVEVRPAVNISRLEEVLVLLQQTYD
ncbi:cell shape-determining protein MreC [Geotalea daltonii FRC-32]|uniref:Cell shape-determining protein MreC n=1 Tax=Geotalea daltonii (strain DSM 22248 / JCM 15807 / FRC-32) TaxID=316067 RepID=B9M5R3_GEODF|nr:rod shape-determining protein MreC [Geotalea daltonii]ACM21822.1 cell shape-determining protein MreC [Geotalea daltonii FRC-32]